MKAFRLALLAVLMVSCLLSSCKKEEAELILPPKESETERNPR